MTNTGLAQPGAWHWYSTELYHRAGPRPWRRLQPPHWYLPVLRDHTSNEFFPSSTKTVGKAQPALTGTARGESTPRIRALKFPHFTHGAEHGQHSAAAQKDHVIEQVSRLWGVDGWTDACMQAVDGG